MRMEFTFRWHRRGVVLHILLASALTGIYSQALGTAMPERFLFQLQDSTDATGIDTVATDTLAPLTTQETKKENPLFLSRQVSGADTLYVADLKKSPYVSVQQYLKGNIAGLYVQENNGEPGTIQHMLLRGISSPIFSNRDLAATQPAVYVNGMPLTQRHPYVYDIKQHDVNPIGSANNMLSGVDMNNILSVE